MKLVIQRVKSSKVEIHSNNQFRTCGAINNGGFMVLVGFTHGDTKTTCQAMAKKLVAVRLFPQLNADGTEGTKDWAANVVERGLKLLLVSQFTLFAKLKGSKPDFHHALHTTEARELYYYFVQAVRAEYHALARKIPNHPAQLVKPISHPVFDFNTIDPLIAQHFIDQAKLPEAERHPSDTTLADIPGLELFSFDQYVQTTQFGSYMNVHLVNDGPVTLLLESVPEPVKPIKDNTRFGEACSASSSPIGNNNNNPVNSQSQPEQQQQQQQQRQRQSQSNIPSGDINPIVEIEASIQLTSQMDQEQIDAITQAIQ